MRLEDAYRTLDVDPGSSDFELKRAHRDLTKVWHPDRFGHDPGLRTRAEEKLKAIHEAYETIREARGAFTPEPVAEEETDPDAPESGWRVRWKGREFAVEDLSAAAVLVDQGAIGEGAEIFDPSVGCWAAAEWIPELKTALARKRLGRERTKAIFAAAAAVFLLLRRPTPPFLLIALVLLGFSLWFLYRMRSAGRAALGPGS
jgi:hypothetical protein